MRIAICLLAVTSTAAATTLAPTTPPSSTSVIRFERPQHGTLGHLALRVRDRASHAHVMVTFELATVAADKQEIVMPLAISRDVEITGLSVALGGRFAMASSLTPHDATKTYDQIKELVRDPALLEWTASRSRTERLMLHVFPVTNDMPATITLEIELAHDATLELDPGPRPLANTVIDFGVATTWATFGAPRTLELADAIHESVYEHADRSHVDRAHSLVAVPELSSAMAPRSSIGDRHFRTNPGGSWLRDNFELIEMVVSHHTPLEHCYALARELDPLTPSTIDLVVRLAPHGAPQVGVGGIAIDEVNTCIVDEVKSWPFPAVDRSVTVRGSADLAHIPQL
jgi:hypothetical protein